VSLIDLPTARAHLRVEDDYPEAQVALYLNAAERLVAEFLNRRVYADDATLAAAVTAVPGALTAASTSYEAAIEAASDIEDAATQTAAKEYAERVYMTAKTAARETYAGIVINEAIEAAILLTMTSLHENRGDDGTPPAMPKAAEHLAYPFRIGLGV
jgi:hypothetical protein